MQRLFVLITVLAAFSTSVVAQPPGLVVSVAASVYDALDEIAGLYRAATGVTVALNAGGSNALARQIVEGAKAGLFLSADNRQMDAVEKAGRIVAGTRTRLLTNELAVIVPAAAASELTLARLLEGGVTRLAMGEPAAVPAGVYGRNWLEHQGAWPRLESKIVPFPTVTRVLSAVENGRVDAGHRVSHGRHDLEGRARDRAGVVEGASVSRHRVSGGRDRRSTRSGGEEVPGIPERPGGPCGLRSPRVRPSSGHA